MHDQDIRDIFSHFDSELSDDARFMERLVHHLDSMEIVKRRSEVMKRHYRTAIAISLAVGFACGCLFSLLLPFVGDAMAMARASLPDSPVMKFAAEHQFPIMLTIIGLASAFISINTFDLTLTIFSKDTANQNSPRRN